MPVRMIGIGVEHFAFNNCGLSSELFAAGFSCLLEEAHCGGLRVCLGSAGRVLQALRRAPRRTGLRCHRALFCPTGSWPRALGSAVNRSSSGSTALRIASRTSAAEFDKLSAVRVWRGRAERRVTSSPTIARTLLTRCL